MLDRDNSATSTFPSTQCPKPAAKFQKFLEADFLGEGRRYYLSKILLTDEPKLTQQSGISISAFVH